MGKINVKNLKANIFLITIIVISHIPLKINIDNYYFPNIILISFFCIYTMSKGNMWHINVIALGLLNDIISNTVIGITSMIFFLYAITLNKVNKAINELNLTIEWLCFSSLTIILLPLKYILINMLNHHGFYINLIFLKKVLITITVYPIFSVLYRKYLDFYNTNA